MSEQREAIAAAMEKASGTLLSLEIEADAVIAHLWQRADDPEAVEEIRESLYTGGPIAADLAAKDRQTRYTETTIEKVLTALIGPRPTGKESANER